jgi:hypothetical protein
MILIEFVLLTPERDSSLASGHRVASRDRWVAGG